MKRRYALEANRVFLSSVAGSQLLIYLVVGLGIRDDMLLQFLIEAFLVLPGISYLVMRKLSVKEGLGVRAVGWKEWLLMIPLAFCLDKIAEFINVISQLFAANSIGSHVAELVIKYSFPMAFFVVAVMPALCEELIYRGVLFQGYRKSGALTAVLLTAFLFGMMHMNLNQFCYAFVLGVLFAFVREITGSILPAVLLHIFVNGKSVVILYASVHYLTGLREQYVQAQAAGDTGLMEELLESAQGVPIDKVSWLQEYMNMGDSSVTELIPSLVPGFIVAVIVTVVILVFLLKLHGGKEKWKELFAKSEEAATEKGERGGWFRCVYSPELLVGVLFCAGFMLLGL